MLRKILKFPVNSVNRNLTTLANGAKLVDFKNNQTDVELTIEESNSTKKTLKFNPYWLRFNCHSPASKNAHTNQRQINGEFVPFDLKVAGLELNGDNLIVNWPKESNQEDSILPLIYLYNNCPSDTNQSTFENRFKPCRELTFFDSRKFFDSNGKKNEEECLRWLNHMAEYGLSIVTNAGTKGEYEVKTFAETMIAPIMKNIYGDVYDVKVEKSPINIAYAEGPLPFHSDLVYYEAPPGIQFIHCVRFDDCIVGGDSLIIDAFDVANEFRKTHPAHFETLTNIPVTFQKMHVKDGKPEVMLHHRPHIKLNHRGEIMAFTWSPANEGPLKHLTDEQVKNYYEAYLHLARAINNSPSIIDYKLKPGEILVFNNRRMMHGRKSFESNNGARHFQGCYINIDEFKSKLRSEIIKSQQGATEKNYVDLKNVKIEKLTIGNNDFE